jgi:hypothetical protein
MKRIVPVVRVAVKAKLTYAICCIGDWFRGSWIVWFLSIPVRQTYISISRSG